MTEQTQTTTETTMTEQNQVTEAVVNETQAQVNALVAKIEECALENRVDIVVMACQTIIATAVEQVITDDKYRKLSAIQNLAFANSLARVVNVTQEDIDNLEKHGADLDAQAANDAQAGEAQQ